MGIPPVSELLIIGGIVLLLFGGKRLPQLGGAIGESIRNFRKGLEGGDDASSSDGSKIIDKTSKTDRSSSDKQS